MVDGTHPIHRFEIKFETSPVWGLLNLTSRFAFLGTSNKRFWALKKTMKLSYILSYGKA